MKNFMFAFLSVLLVSTFHSPLSAMEFTDRPIERELLYKLARGPSRSKQVIKSTSNRIGSEISILNTIGNRRTKFENDYLNRLLIEQDLLKQIDDDMIDTKAYEY